ncbi:hypothetical protein RF55_9994 [Lasius niger]|uniref:Uncharacterized protein n=1 Tax=Lasius niger TaxID=67767 RepID=A0A0J7KJ75_LASNI|nr:hypothetical protein RF55_9991 [Lasius niger]KMQ90269.1 hypothetical protein RF55_9994 [Lasius niger]
MLFVFKMSLRILRKIFTMGMEMIAMRMDMNLNACRQTAMGMNMDMIVRTIFTIVMMGMFAMMIVIM